MKTFNIFGEITNETAKDFAAFFNGTKDAFAVRINSHGGDIFAALGIFNLIRSRKNVSIRIEGLAASAATLICCAAKCTACKNSMILMHLPMAELSSLYNTVELEKIQQNLNAIKGAVIETYLTKLKLTAEEIENQMLAETWLDAAQAQKIGLVDEILNAEVEMKLSADKRILYVNSVAIENKNLPEVIKLEETKNEKSEDTKAVMSKYKNAILTTERARVAALMAMKNDSPAVNSIINRAIENGDEVERIKPYIDAITSAAKVENKIEESPKIKNLDELYKMLTDNLQSGAANVDGSTPPPDEEAQKAAETQKYVDNVAKYANEILKGAC